MICKPDRLERSTVCPSACLRLGLFEEFLALLYCLFDCPDIEEGLLGEVIESGETEQIFSLPKDSRTEAYVTGRFG